MSKAMHCAICFNTVGGNQPVNPRSAKMAAVLESWRFNVWFLLTTSGAIAGGTPGPAPAAAAAAPRCSAAAAAMEFL